MEAHRGKIRPKVLLIGQSRAGKSKFISEFIHESVNKYLPIRAYGQTTKFISFYELVPNDYKSLKYEISFLEEEEIKDKFLNLLQDVEEYYNNNKQDDSFETFKKQLTKNEDKLFDVKKLIGLKSNNNEFMNKLYDIFIHNEIEDSLNYMVEELYTKTITMNNLEQAKEFPLDQFCKKDKRFLEAIEPLIKKVVFTLPVSQKYDKYLFNEDNNGVTFIDTVGTDHTGTDKIDKIFGMYSSQFNIKPDITTFINDFNDFREKTKAVKNIFKKIIDDNSLSNFILVNTKLDMQLKSTNSFRDLREEDYEEFEYMELVSKFRIDEEEITEDIFSQISKGFNLAISENSKLKNLNENDRKLVIKKVESRFRKNSIFISNPEIDDADCNSMSNTDFDLYNKISCHNLQSEISKFIKLIYDNYRRIQNSNIIYLKKIKDCNDILKIQNINELENVVINILEEFKTEYNKLRFPYYNSIRALSNGFYRQRFEAASSAYYKCFPDTLLFSSIKKYIKDNDYLLEKNYEVDFSRISKDEYIFENVDPIISEKLIKLFTYSDFLIVWNEIVRFLIEAEQYEFPKKIDENWYSKEIVDSIEDYYSQDHIKKFSGIFETETDRWNLMGNIIGHQIHYVIEKHKEQLTLLIIEFIIKQIVKISTLVGKELIFYEDASDEIIKAKILEKSTYNKPYIITEGKTDWKHYKHALNNFKENGKFADLDVEFYEYDEEIKMGDAELDKLLCYVSKLPKDIMRVKIIGVFDNDSSIGKKYQENDYVNKGNNVFGCCINTPEHRNGYDGISVELLYKDEDLFRMDENGRRIYLSSEFNSQTGRHNENINTNIANTGKIKGKTDINKSIIIDSDVFNEFGESLAMSKEAFANEIYQDENRFTNLDLSGFETLFVKISKILNE